MTRNAKDPDCQVCGDSMIHCHDGSWGCADVFFSLLDADVFGENAWLVIFEPEPGMPDWQREALEHWRASQICLVADGAFL